MPNKYKTTERFHQLSRRMRTKINEEDMASEAPKKFGEEKLEYDSSNDGESDRIQDGSPKSSGQSRQDGTVHFGQQQNKIIGDNNRDKNNNLKTKQRSIIPHSIEHRMVPIVLKFLDMKFLLIQLDDEQMASNPQVKDLTPLFDDPKILEYTIGELFEIIRTDDDLLELHNFTDFDELILNVPELDNIAITEDNIYCRNILVNDFTKIFNALLFKTKDYGNISPISLHFEITSQPRFITNFNNLNDLIRLGYGLDRISYRKKLYNRLINTKDTEETIQDDNTNDSDDPNDTQSINNNVLKKQKIDQ